MSFDIYSVLGILVATFAGFGMAFWITMLINRDKSKLSSEVASLSVQREYAERQISDLMDRLQDSEERFLELNRLVLEGKTSFEKTDIGQSENRSELLKSKFLKDLGVEAEKISLQKRQAFYITPFSKRHAQAHEFVRAACLEKRFSLVRSDEQHVSGSLLKKIVESIIESNIIIANVSGRNANVFYELAIAQMLEKRVILIASTVEDLAFDVAGQGIVIYRSGPDLKKKLETAIENSFFGI